MMDDNPALILILTCLFILALIGMVGIFDPAVKLTRGKTKIYITMPEGFKVYSCVGNRR